MSAGYEGQQAAASCKIYFSVYTVDPMDYFFLSLSMSDFLPFLFYRMMIMVIVLIIFQSNTNMYIDFLNINKINHQRIKFFILDRFEKKTK